MASQKADNLLNLALEVSLRERESAPELQTGYDPMEQTWELILKYDQKQAVYRPELQEVIPLSFGYGIARVKEHEIPRLLALPEIEYAEKPKRLFFAMNQGKAASCFSGRSVKTESEHSGGGSGEVPLTGKGILTAVVDSGVDYFHADFRKEDGSTRILALWDQTVDTGRPPEGFRQGSEFRAAQINEALAAGSREAGYRLVPSVDYSGHGTAVLGILAGNGNASGGKYIGGAPESEILAVKLGIPGETGFPGTTQLMQAVEYVIRKAQEYGRPVAINLSYGTVYGSHSGTSLLENYLNQMAGKWKNVIVTGAGNEGSGYGHAAGTLREEQVEQVELSIGEYEPSLDLQLWKNYADTFEVTFSSPSGQGIKLPPPDLSLPGDRAPGVWRYRLEQTDLLVYYGTPVPYSISQEIFVQFLPSEAAVYLNEGIWQIELTPQRIVEGGYDLWLPGEEVRNPDTRFLRPSPEATLTIPSAAEKLLSVGAYDSAARSYAAFSGRGYTRYPQKIKPELSAPGVNITTTAVGGGYGVYTGTSFAAPFVTAAAALLMQWGIVLGRDPYLYGEKVKAYLQKGAHHLPGYSQWPNNQMGYGEDVIIRLH